MILSDGSENDGKSNGSSGRRAERREVLSNIADNQSNGSSSRTDKWVADSDPEKIETLNESDHVEIREGFEELEPPNGMANGSQRLGFRRNPARDIEGIRYSTSNYSEDGPSNDNLRSSYGYVEPLKRQSKPNEFNKVEYLGQDRDELLRKLDELKDQLSRSCDMNEKPKERVPSVQRSYGGSETLFYNDSWGSNRPSGQYPIPDPYLARPPYPGYYPEPSPYISGNEMGMNSFYPSMHNTNQMPRFGDPMRSQMPRRAHPYFSGQYADPDMVQFEPYPPHMNPHHPSCSCFHCYKIQQVRPPVQTTAFHNNIFPSPDLANNPMYYPCENPVAFGPRDYNSKLSNPYNPRSHTRWPIDLNSEVGGFLRRRPPRVVVPTGARHCHPIAGGAPFVLCYNCFELLQLPKKLLLIEAAQNKVHCGACSTVIVFSVANKRLVLSIDADIQKPSKVVDENSYPHMKSTDGTSNSHVHVNQASTNFSSEDFNNSGYDFHSMDHEGFCSGKSVDMRSPHSTSLYCSEDEGNNDYNSLDACEKPNSAELAAKANPSPPPAGSPLQDYFDYSNKYHAVCRIGKGNQSGRSERENVEVKKVSSRQNSMKDVSLATETEVSFNEYSNSGTSQEFGVGSKGRREYQPRANKGGQSFFGGFIKKSFRDFSRSNSNTGEQCSINVTINGQQMPDCVLRKAEKLAGPIHPGQYWYDFRAGFWGVMGGPCLGIIPPFIEQFNYPMPENCAAGDTGVLVNGRELHQKDLNLLSNRGLPTARDKSYILEISGRVLDEETGEELDSLGKLAPTVEKMKRGFGMKPPKAAA
ncbi:hypothetical protein NMG60_11028945 [Bertholletia excelsa]